MDPRLESWSQAMKKAGKLRLFGFSTHSNMEDCLEGAARLPWIDGIMFTYNYRLMHQPRMQAAVEACYRAGIGLTAMKNQGGGPVMSDSESELEMAGRFMQKGFTPHQAKLMAVWGDKRIASICSQMPNLTIMATNAVAAVDQIRLSQSDRNLLAQYDNGNLQRLLRRVRPYLFRSAWQKGADKRCHALSHVRSFLPGFNAGTFQL